MVIDCQILKWFVFQFDRNVVSSFLSLSVRRKSSHLIFNGFLFFIKYLPWICSEVFQHDVIFPLDVVVAVLIIFPVWHECLLNNCFILIKQNFARLELVAFVDAWLLFHAAYNWVNVKWIEGSKLEKSALSIDFL